MAPLVAPQGVRKIRQSENNYLKNRAENAEKLLVFRSPGYCRQIHSRTATPNTMRYTANTTKPRRRTQCMNQATTA